MTKLPQRKSPRLPDYDYSKAGGYFITICTYEKEHHFGNIKNAEMILSDIGQIAHDRWAMIPEFFPSVELSDFIIMPNHTHGILFLSDSHESNQPSVQLSQTTKPVSHALPDTNLISHQKCGNHAIMITSSVI